jgi:hypothetical protein
MMKRVGIAQKERFWKRKDILKHKVLRENEKSYKYL